MVATEEISGLPVDDTISARWIFERIDDWATRLPGRFAFAVDREGNVPAVEYRYGDVARIIERVASGLHAHGIARQDRIGILMENIPEWVFVLLGALRAGAIAVPLSTLLPESAIARLAAHAGVKLIFSDGVNLEKAMRVAAVEGIAARVVAVGTEAQGALAWEGFENAAGPAPPLDDIGAADAALIIYTSGTTGDPKGVQLSLGNLNHEVRGAVEAFQFSSDHRVLSTLPFSHILPLIANALGPLAAGAGVVFLASVSSQRMIEAFRVHRITCFVCVPQFFYLLHRRIFDEAGKAPWGQRTAFALAFGLAKRIRSPRLRYALFAGVRRRLGPDLSLLASGGARFDPLIAGDLTILGYTVVQAYGLTETSSAATVTALDAIEFTGVGKPIRGVSIRIDQPNREGVGEVWIRGPVVMTGYYRDPERTREAMSGEWFRSGDLGRILPDRTLAIAGRIKDVIVLASGKKVDPEELELHYGRSPLVKEICIIGRPSVGAPDGEILHAVVVPDMEEFRRRGETVIAGSLRFEIENLSKELPPYQRALSLTIRNEPLPRTATRKLRRFEIREDERMRLDHPGAADGVRPASPKFDAVWETGAGAVVAELVRAARPQAPALDPAMSFELDLGFDSLARIELFALAEARMSTRVDEAAAARVLNLGDLVQALEQAQNSPAGGKNWSEILATPDPQMANHPVFHRGRLIKTAGYAAIKTVALAASVLFPLRSRGQEFLPREGPYLICPNHESYLDGPLVVAVLPRAAIDKIFILGYSDHWRKTPARALAHFLSIVSVDSSINLVRAMQAGAAGLRQGRALLIFPEGTRSIDGGLKELKKGAAMLACAAGVPIVPAGIRGAFQAWPRGGSFMLHPIEIAFGAPIHPRDFKEQADPAAALTEALRESIRELAGQ